MRKELFYLACIFLCTSCYSPRYVYSPSTANVPLLNGKGEVYAAAQYATNLNADRTNNTNSKKLGAKTNGFDAHFAYAINKNWLLMGNYFYRHELNNGNSAIYLFDSSIINYHRSKIEIGGGYFSKINDESDLQYQLLGGVGLGNSGFTDKGRLFNSLDPFSREIKYKQINFFVQPAIIGSVFEKRLYTALASRFDFVKIYDVKDNYTTEEKNIFFLNNLDQKIILFWQPNLIFSYQLKKDVPLSLMTGVGLNFLLSKKFYDTRFANYSIGINYHYRYKRKTENNALPALKPAL